MFLYAAWAVGDSVDLLNFEFLVLVEGKPVPNLLWKFLL